VYWAQSSGSATFVSPLTADATARIKFAGEGSSVVPRLLVEQSAPCQHVLGLLPDILVSDLAQVLKLRPILTHPANKISKQQSQNR